MIRKLPDAELEVMQALWACAQPAHRADIEAKLPPSHPMAQTTLLTLLTRLSEKGFLRIEKQGRVSAFCSLISKEDYQAAQSKRFLDQIFGGNLSAFATALCSSGLTKEDIAELRALLEKEAE